MSRLALLFALAALLAAAEEARAQTSADSVAIRQAALDYIEGWYEGDADRMAAALHPELVKRIVVTDRQNQKNRLDQMDASTLIDATRQGGGRDTPPARQRRDVRILDIFGNTSSVRVDAGDWIDYMHLARFDGEWKIINVLWEMR